MKAAKKPWSVRLLEHLANNWLYDVIGLVVIVYLANRLYRLTNIPVFADEAIYIYWAQLAASDWGRYAFASMNDGKTPLIIWLMIPLLKLLRDPLVAGRLLSVMFGLGQMIVAGVFTAVFTDKKRYHFLAAILVIFCRGLMLNNRLALMDSASGFLVMLTYVCAFVGALGLSLGREEKAADLQHRGWWWLALGSLSFGLALWVKFSNLLILPMLATIFLFDDRLGDYWRQRQWRALARACGWTLVGLGTIVIIGGSLFATLKLSASFPGIFRRGGDFLYTLSEFSDRPVEIMLGNWRFFWQVLTNYGGIIMVMATIILAAIEFLGPKQREVVWILLAALAYALPIILFGKVVYPRYYLPVIPFVIVAFCISLANIQTAALFNFKTALIILVIGAGMYNCWRLHTLPHQAGLLPADQEQLFQEWSSGHVIKQTAQFLARKARHHRLLVMTEGHIGTLPDGLQIYLWKAQERNNMRIVGLGAPPVKNYGEYAREFADYDQVWLVVNSHRLELEPEASAGALIKEYARPGRGAPSLQVWQIK